MYAIAVLGCTLAACDDDDDDKPALVREDQQFVENAAMSNMAEAELGGLAASKGPDSLVKAFGQHMATEHNAAQQELKGIADRYGNVSWPKALDAQHQQIRELLTNATGAAFDSIYISSQVNDHQAALDVFDSEISNGSEEKVKAYANKYRPHIAQHLQLADSIYSMMIKTN